MGQIANKPHLAYGSKINVLTYQFIIGRPSFFSSFPFSLLMMTGRSKLLASKGIRIQQITYNQKYPDLTR
jgi:hypothetical protein